MYLSNCVINLAFRILSLDMAETTNSDFCNHTSRSANAFFFLPLMANIATVIDSLLNVKKF